MHPVDEMPLPVKFRPGERLEHPVLTHLRHTLGYPSLEEETLLRQVAASYFGLVTHLDEQIGEVTQAAELLDTTARTRLLYTSDHGERFGNNGLMGKFQPLETGAAVPLLVCGPDIPQGKVSSEIVSHVDGFPTLLEGFDVEVLDDDDVPGQSLWPAIQGPSRERIGFAEYHAAASLAGSYMIRRGGLELIYHAGGMPPQIFDLADDPYETDDLTGTGEGVGGGRNPAWSCGSGWIKNRPISALAGINNSEHGNSAATRSFARWVCFPTRRHPPSTLRSSRPNS
jgi:choline-sulfatase